MLGSGSDFVPNAIGSRGSGRNRCLTPVLAAALLGLPSFAFGLTLEYSRDRAPELVNCDRMAYRGEAAASAVVLPNPRGRQHRSAHQGGRRAQCR